MLLYPHVHTRYVYQVLVRKRTPGAYEENSILIWPPRLILK